MADRVAGSGSARSLRTAMLVLSGAWALLFAPQLFARQTFVLGDARVYRPFAEYSRQRWLGEHERTYWNPYVLTGVPASASLADMRPQYLPDLALDWFERVRPGRVVPLAAPLVAHLVGMCAMAALAWRLWTLPTVALVWAGLAWGLSPLLLVPFAFGHTAVFVALSLVPPMLLAVVGVARSETRRNAIGAALGLAGLVGLQALTGHPQVVVYSATLVLAFAIERSIRARRPDVAVAAVLALAWGAALAAAVWYPALRYGEHSVRAAGVSLEDVRTMSIAWRELLGFAFPQIVGGAGDTYWGGLIATDYPRFFGTTVLLFLALGLRRGSRAPDEATGFLIATCIGAVFLALGPRTGPLYSALRAGLPMLGFFRVASMALVVAVPAVALLSARGVGNLLAGPSRQSAACRNGLWWLPASLLALGLVLLTAGPHAYAGLARALRADLPLEQGLRAARQAGFDLAWRAILLGGVLLLIARARDARLAPAALWLLLAVDLGSVSAPILRRATAPESQLDSRSEPALARFGREEPGMRVWSTRVADVSRWQVSGLGLQPEMRANDWIRWRAHAYGGEHGTPPAKYEEMTFLSSTEAVRALGVGYLSSPPDVPQDSSAFEIVASTPGETVYRLRQALGRAYAVRSVRALGSEAAIVRALLAEDFLADRVAFVLGEAGSEAGEYPGSHTARIHWRRDDPDELALSVESDARAFVVVADAWFPGWTATLDGANAAIARVDHSLRGVAIPAGTHELRMSYRPEGGEAGRLSTRVAGALWLLSAFAWLVLRRTSHQSAARAATSSS